MAIGFQVLISRTKKGKVKQLNYITHAVTITFTPRFNSWTIDTDHYAPSHIAEFFKEVEKRLCGNGRIVHDSRGRVLEHD